MSLVRTVVALFFAAALPARAAGAAEVKRTFPVEPGCTLQVDSYRALLTIEESDEAEIRVAITIDAEADPESAAQRLRDGVQVNFEADAHTVRIRATNPRVTGVRLDLGNDERVDLIYKISVPRRCSVDLVAGEGNFTVGNLTGRVVARLKRGPIFLRRIEGSVDAQTELGDVVVSRCSGAVTARTRRGVIRLGTIGGQIEATNNTGDIEIMTAKAGVRANAEAGDITVGFGPKIAAEAHVTVSGGNVFAKIHPEAACRLDATSVWGRVHCALPLAVTAGGNDTRHLQGRLNAGGPLLTLRASGGAVRITPDVALMDDAAAP